MYPTRWGVLILALSVTLGAAVQASAQVPTYTASDKASHTPAPINPSPRSDAPSPARLDQPGAVVIAPPIARNAGRIVIARDEPLLGRLNLQGQSPQGSVSAPPPAMPPPPPTEAALSVGAGRAGARGRLSD